MSKNLINQFTGAIKKGWNNVRSGGNVVSNYVGKAANSLVKGVPAILLLCEINEKGGLSALAITSAIISRLNEAGIPSGLNADGSPNLINAYTRIAVEEIVNAIKKDMQVYLVPPPGSIKSVVTGTCAVGPVTGTAINVDLKTITGGAN